MSINLAATWNRTLVYENGAVTAIEGRALNNLARWRSAGDSPEGRGLNCWSPCVNVLRDPRWGRSAEIFGEDPFLISEIAVAKARGTQECRRIAPQYVAVAATTKHFAAHNGPEDGPVPRTKLVANVSLFDLYDTYFVGQQAAIQQVGCLMPLLANVV